jgi:hypothetical protein
MLYLYDICYLKIIKKGELMPYRKETYRAQDVRSIIEREGLKVDSSIEWKDVGVGKVVVFGREVIGNSLAMEISIADDKKSLAKEKKIPAKVIFTIKSYSSPFQSLLIIPPPRRVTYARKQLLCHVF